MRVWYCVRSRGSGTVPEEAVYTPPRARQTRERRKRILLVLAPAGRHRSAVSPESSSGQAGCNGVEPAKPSTTSTATGLFHHSQRDFRCLCLGWAVSGEQRGSSGSRRGSTPPKWAMLEASPPTPPTKRPAQVEQVILRLSGWSGSQRRQVSPNCSRCFGRATTQLKVLMEGGFGEITTEIAEAHEFYYAEDYHQQYLSKNPRGYCGLSGTGVSCPIGLKK
ncbi:uncharacterized protein LOC129817427 isoform X4 [Salvelinus fontinalis]|uniref:uncharacterized protein LOC129817427 isoform X4 n=1 Tax=Salvelinus fontinalis TaxID=8038 RepID=UPI0024854CCB|nr:uncharacterized protein LOC129817427 isoform X4 [Salvelinus fontinalis]